jgi:hypothetical protein
MHLKFHPLLSSLALLAATTAGLHAESGRIEATRGSTSLVRGGMVQRLAVASTLQGGDGLRTGSNGQSQMDAGNATIRAGSNTDLLLKNNRNGLTLNSGIVLVSNKSKGSGFDLETDRHRATSYGTMQVSYLKDKYLKVLCVEGKVKVSLKALMGDSVTLRPGQMVTITPTEDRLPEPSMVNLSRLASTSALLGPGFVVPKLAFPGGNRVSATIAAQEQAVAAIGRKTRDKSMTDADKTLAGLTRYNGSGGIAGEFQSILGQSGIENPTPEMMYQIFYNASKGAYVNRTNFRLPMRRGGRP